METAKCTFFFFFVCVGEGCRADAVECWEWVPAGLDLMAGAGQGWWPGWAGLQKLPQGGQRGEGAACSACSPSQPGNKTCHGKVLFHPTRKNV